MPTKYRTIEEARQILAMRTPVKGTPMRLRPIIIDGPTGGFCVVTVKWARDNGFID